VLSDLEALCNKAPIATLAVTTQEMTDGQQDQRMTRFLAQLTASNGTDAPIPLRPHPAL
jgi:hypothetical protein